MKNQRTRKKEPVPKQERSTITREDLLALNARELRRVHQLVTELVRDGETDDLNKDDVVLAYEVRLLTKDGVVYTNKGKSPLNSIMNSRLLPEAPGRLHTEFMHNVFSPVYAAALDLFDESNPTQKSIHLLEDEHDNDLSLPGDDLYPTTLS